MAIVKTETELNGKKLILETGRVARQSHGAVMAQLGDTVVLATVLSAAPTRDIDYFPLYVDYREMQYAGGKFPGGFFKREGRPSTKEILSARMIDRTIRPLFPKDFSDEVQIQCMVIATDKNHDADVVAMIGSSAALALSHAPFLGPIAAVRIAHVDGEFVIFPTYEQRESASFEMIVSGHRDAVNMLELAGKEVGEDVVFEAVQIAHKHIQAICGDIDGMAKQAGREVTYESTLISEELMALVTEKCGARIKEAKQLPGKVERGDAVAAIKEEVLAELCPEDVEEPEHSPADVTKALYKLEGKMQRELILDGIRPDGRDPNSVRPLDMVVPFLPRVHGSAIFSRGETQAMATVTLGTPRDQQKIDGLQEEYFKRFIMHYNFPPFSVGEIRPVRGPGRRDIGHGALAEKSLHPTLPSADDFPYTIRVVSEILESNGSSSMASVCAGTLAMLDAGVPVTAPIAGISVGLVSEGDRKILLTDIIGEEDYHGDMDFKVAGSRNGITGMQVDTKPAEGIDMDTIRGALDQAREARHWLLDEMAKVIAEPRADISQYAPRLLSIQIDPEKIGKVIGTGGKIINGLSQKYEVTIDIEDDGTVFIGGSNAELAEQARAEIQAMTEEVQLGRIYTGKVVSIRDFGAFIEILPGQDGLCHVSELDENYVKNVNDVVSMGDELRVKVINIDDQGRVKLSRKAVIVEDKAKEGAGKEGS